MEEAERRRECGECWKVCRSSRCFFTSSWSSVGRLRLLILRLMPRILLFDCCDSSKGDLIGGSIVAEIESVLLGSAAAAAAAAGSGSCCCSLSAESLSSILSPHIHTLLLSLHRRYFSPYRI